MRTSIRLYQLIVLILFFISILSCQKDDDQFKIRKDKLSGYVQKGPYINGTFIQMYELNSSLSQTGKVFSTQVIDNKGSFEITNIALTSQFVEFSAIGYYFNEITGDISPSTLSFYAISDITDISTVNVNILTHLEKNRVDYLVSGGKDFSEAKDTAQKEVLAIFGYQLEEMENSELLDIAVNKDENAILLAISIILQGYRSVGDLTELLANITTDIMKDGKLDNDSIISDLRNTTLVLDLANIRSNLETRYSNLGIDATIPEFEKKINDFLTYTGQEPGTSTLAPTNITATEATLRGSVNANDLSTTVTFEYGTTADYGSTATVALSPFTGHNNITFRTTISDLSPGTTYHYRVKSVNSLGATFGGDRTFTTIGQVPASTTNTATNITTMGASLNGTVNANDLSTTVTFEYGTTTDYGSIATATQSPLTGHTNTTVSATVSDLSLGTTYHFRVRAVNTLGITVGNDLSFATTITGVTGTVSDYEGNIYKTVGIGNQMWMAENLRTTKFNDGISIPLVTDNVVWINLTTPGYCWYNNDPTTNKATYGALYNWYAVSTTTNGNNNICPTGWHVPTMDEWETLSTYLGGRSVAGGKLKETGTLHWTSPNNGATNETLFTALPGGFRSQTGVFIAVGDLCYWWTDTESNQASYAWRNVIFNTSSLIDRFDDLWTNGSSLRCIRD